MSLSVYAVARALVPDKQVGVTTPDHDDDDGDDDYDDDCDDDYDDDDNDDNDDDVYFDLRPQPEPLYPMNRSL
jgi:hypothetical protein